MPCRWRSTGTRWRVPTAGTWRRRARCCSTRRRVAPCPPIPRALARSCAAPGPRNTRLDLWAEPGAQARVARSIARQFAAVGVQVTVRVGARPGGAQAWIQWLSPAYGDPAAIFMPLADALADGPQAGVAARVTGVARLAGDARRAAFRRLDRETRRRRNWRDSAAACKLFYTGLVHAGG